MARNTAKKKSQLEKAIEDVKAKKIGPAPVTDPEPKIEETEDEATKMPKGAVKKIPTTVFVEAFQKDIDIDVYEATFGDRLKVFKDRKAATAWLKSKRAEWRETHGDVVFKKKFEDNLFKAMKAIHRALDLDGVDDETRIELDEIWDRLNHIVG